MSVECLNISVLVRVRLCLVLSVPLSAPDLQLCGLLSELVDTVGGSQDDPRSNERSSTLVQIGSLGLTTIPTLLLYGLLVENSAHVGPLTKLGLRLCESLDPYSKTILVPSSTLGSILDLWSKHQGSRDTCCPQE